MKSRLSRILVSCGFTVIRTNGNNRFLDLSNDTQQFQLPMKRVTTKDSLCQTVSQGANQRIDICLVFILVFRVCAFSLDPVLLIGILHAVNADPKVYHVLMKKRTR